MAWTQCNFCSYSYDEWEGDARNGVPAGIPIVELAGTVCSRCGIQGERHQRQPAAPYSGLEAEYYDHFSGKAGIAFYRDWLLEEQQRKQGDLQVLELGVGTGRIAIGIAQAGISVTGVDSSADMLAIADKKRKQRLLEHADRVRLMELDILGDGLQGAYSHVLAADGLLQHFTRQSEQRQLLRTIREHLLPDGRLAIDRLLPEASPGWREEASKRVQNKVVYKRLEGQTSLRRQLFRYRLTYETYADGVEQSRFRVERELSLMLPRELGLLLESEGFGVTAMLENYGEHPAWSEARPASLEPIPAPFSREETLAEYANQPDQREGVSLHQPDAWRSGGYPLWGNVSPSLEAAAGTRWTVLAVRQR